MSWLLKSVEDSARRFRVEEDCGRGSEEGTRGSRVGRSSSRLLWGKKTLRLRVT